MAVGFEDGEGFNSYFNKSSGCSVVESNEGYGNRALVMPISSTEPATVYACVCGQGGDVSFKYKQPSTIANLLFYQEGSSNSITCSDSRELALSPILSVGPGKQKLIWKYKFRERSGNGAIRSTALIDDIQFKGEIGLCDCNRNLDEPPGKPRVEGPTATTVGCKTSFKEIINNENVFYEFNWGDGSRNETRYYSTNQEINESHTWMKPGKYQLVVTAINNNNIRSIPQNITINVNLKEVYIYHPGDDFINKLKNANYTIFYLEEGHYNKRIDLGNKINNIIIKPFPNSRTFGVVIEAGSDGPYCINLTGTSNITIQDMVLKDGNISIIMSQSKNISITNNKLIDFKLLGLNITNCTPITVNDNRFKSEYVNCKGIALIDSNSTTSCRSVIKNNVFNIPPDCFAIISIDSCGNKIYLNKSINWFKDNDVYCGLINSTPAGKYICNNGREFEFDPSVDYHQENFCNNLFPEIGV